MGTAIDSQTMQKRSGKLGFLLVSGSTYARMEGFTDLSESLNATEYSRRYVDEDTDRTSLTGYSPSWAYTFDRYIDNSVLDVFVNIHENLLTGDDAVVSMVQVDMSTVTLVNGHYTATGYYQKYTVVPDGDGSTTDAMTYSGTMKAYGGRTAVTVTLDSTAYESCSITGYPVPEFSTVRVTDSNSNVETVTVVSGTSSYTLSTITSGTIYITPTTTIGGVVTYAVYGSTTYWPSSYGVITVTGVTAGGSIAVYARTSTTSDSITITTAS